MLTIYEYPSCSTCKKAKKFLKDNNIKANFFNVKEKTPSVEELLKIVNKFEIPIKSLFNTSGLVYRELNLKEKLPSLSTNEALSLLSSNGMLIKRPLVFDLKKNILLIGFKEENWKNSIL